MLIAHKIALDPNNVQATYLKKACGVARFAYNWALEQWGLSSQTISCSISRVIVFFAHGLAAISGSTASSAGCEACGEEGSGRRRKTAVKPPR